MFTKSENISKCADHIVDEEPHADGEVSGGARESVPLHHYDFSIFLDIANILQHCEFVSLNHSDF